MYSLGWRVFRDEFSRCVPAERRRRSVVVGVLVAIASAVVLVGVGLVTPWPDLGSAAGLVGVVMLALAVGVLGAALVPLRPTGPDGARLYWSGAMTQARDGVEQYFRRGGAPTIDPADRDDVLRDAAVIRAGMVPEVYRGLLLLVVVVLGTVAVVLLEVPARIVLWVALIAVVRTVTNVIRLGRVERARALAELLPDAPPRAASTSVRPGRPGTRSGSKLGLPGEDG
ncbi:hypothetical protein [Curtobacterium sp. VKM Ac-2922]|uniref:hypothetical protein n=1 Tax=Curtobacterium sp. VKM Ac-2922 TaxID=2929475 RepID=UPI001FB4953A|nr:hypothetical protein [Curtobacterium sp. VKM Ac-2922]MCJ1714165.1 hypothetical protein [Curtobacterium sp. VKM Ac-2922]